MTFEPESPDAVLAAMLDGIEPKPPNPRVGAPLPASTDAAAPRADRAANGRFLPGHKSPGPGRTPGLGLDLRALAEREAKRDGIDLNKAAWLVLKKLLE